MNPGELVTLRQDIPNKPTMIVVKKETSVFKHQRKSEDKKPILIGIKCRCRTKKDQLQKAVFSTKDLIKI